jgi:hypothetical protein
MLDDNKLNFKEILHGNVKCLCVIQGICGWLVLVNTVPLCSWRVFRGFTIRISAETLSVLTDGFRDFTPGKITVDYFRSLSKAFQFVIRCHFSFPSILSEFFKTSSSHLTKWTFQSENMNMTEYMRNLGVEGGSRRHRHNNDDDDDHHHPVFCFTTSS